MLTALAQGSTDEVVDRDVLVLLVLDEEDNKVVGRVVGVGQSRLR